MSEDDDGTKRDDAAARGAGRGVTGLRLPVPSPRGRRVVTRLGWALLVVFLLGVFPAALLSGGLTRGQAWGAFLSALAIVLVVVFAVVRPARQRRGLVSPVVQVADEVPRPVPLPARVEGPVRACMRCGSRDLAVPGLRDGVWLGGGELQFLVCRNCSTRAPPLEFERGEDYLAFLKDLQRG